MTGYPFTSRAQLTAAELNSAVEDTYAKATGSTSRRWLSDRLAEVRNPLDFGGTGDGSADDTAALQAAAAELPATGGVLLLPAGYTFKRTDPVVLPSGSVVLGHGARVVGPGGFISGDVVFKNTNAVTYAGITEQTDESLQTDERIAIIGLTVSEVCLCQFLLARHLYIADCFGDFSNAVPNSFVQIRGCDGWVVENNVAMFCSAGVDVWQGSTRGRIRNNRIKVFVNSGALGNKYGIGINALGSNASGNLRNVPQLTDDIVVEGNTIEVNGTAAGIQFDPLAVGCVTRRVVLRKNTIVGASGVNNYGIYARGDVQDSEVSGNKIYGCNPPGNVAPIHLGGYFGTLVTGTDTITTTSGSASVVVKYPNNACAVGGWVRLNADPSGDTTAVGGLTFNGYYPITAVSAGAFTDANATVTITAASAASSSATGGGGTEIVSYFGQPARCRVEGNVLRSCGNASGALIFVGGTAHHIINNDMTDCDPSAYQALTHTDQLDAPASATQWGSVIIGNIGAPGTGISGTSNSTRNAYVRKPLIIEARNETATPTWWIKGPVEFADEVTWATEAATWTPTITFGGASVGITYSLREATYTVLGNLVWVEAQITLTSKGSSTGTALIGGLPFPDATGVVPASFNVYSWANSSTLTAAPHLRVSSQSIVLSTAPYGGTALTNTDFANNTALAFAGLYRIN